MALPGKAHKEVLRVGQGEEACELSTLELDPNRPGSRRKGDVGGARLWPRPQLIIDWVHLLSLG